MAHLRQQLLQGLRPVRIVHDQLNHRGCRRSPGASQRRIVLDDEAIAIVLEKFKTYGLRIEE